MHLSPPRDRRRRLITAALVVAGAWLAHGLWADSRQGRLGRDIAALAGPGAVHMIASDTCSPCVEARRWLRHHGVPFSECSIEREPACRARFDAFGAPGTPLLLVHGRPQLGLSPERLLAALELPQSSR
jgi:glutaredoxin